MRMKQSGPAFAILATVLALSVGVATASSSPPIAPVQSGSSPTLRLGKRSPLTLRANGFKTREAVAVVVKHDGRTFRKHARASATGAFVVRFGDVALDPCDAMSARAVGNLGSLAILKLPKRACITS